MTTSETAAALVEWAGEVTEIEGGETHEPKARTEPLPDVWAVTSTVAYANAPKPEIEQVEQSRYKLSEFRLMLFVEPEPADDAAEALNGYADALGAAAEADRSLGGRVDNIDPAFTFDFHLEQPFAELSDGSRARRMTMTLVVVEALRS